jgi:hypothetical protein
LRTAALGTTVTVLNFVDGRLTLAGAIGQDLDVTVVGAKRGSVATADGDDAIDWFLHSNEGSWNNTASISAGAGNDSVLVSDVSQITLDNALLADNAAPGNGLLWNNGYSGRFSIAAVDGGTGDDLIEAAAVRTAAASTPLTAQTRWAISRPSRATRSCWSAATCWPSSAATYPSVQGREC